MAGISIIIPTRNEAENIDLLLQRIFKGELPEGVSREIIFVDDSSTDETRSHVLKWSASHPEVRLVCRNNDAGLASAVIEGAHHANYDVILVMDADLSHPPEKIADMVMPLLDGSHDMVIGSRYVAGGATPEWPLARRIASKIATIPARLFTDVNDPLAGFFATSRDRMTCLRPDVPGFKICLEVLAVGGPDLNVLEIPIVFHDRFEGFSKMNKKIIFAYLKQVAQLLRLDVDIFTPKRLALFGTLALLVNLCFFTGGLLGGFTPVSAHLLGGAGGWLVICLLGIKVRKRSDATKQVKGWQMISAVLALFISISLQGAVFTLIQKILSPGNLVAFIPAAITGTLCSLTMLCLYTFSGLAQAARDVRLRVGAFTAILVLIMIRLVYLPLPELMEQEAYYWNYAQHLGLSYLDHPPLTALLIWCGTALFGTTEFGVRIGGFLCWFITAYFIYRLSLRMFGRTAALGAIVLLSALPLYFGIGFVMTPDAPLHAAWAALLYSLYRALIDNRSDAWLWVGVSLGLGMISKYTIILLGPAVLCFMIMDRRSRPWLVRSEPYGAFLIALFIFSPVLIWNFQHDWASFLFQGADRVAGRTFFTTDRLLGYITLILTPAGLLSVLYYFFRGNRFRPKKIAPRSIPSRAWVNREFLFTLLMILFPLSVFFLFSITKEVKLNWTSPVWLAALPFLGCTVMAVFDLQSNRFLRLMHELMKFTIILLVVSFSLAMHYVSIGFPGVPYPAGPFLIGWDDVGRRIEQLVDDIEKETGRRPVVVGMDHYQLSSAIAFYRSKLAAHDKGQRRRRGVDETLGWHLFGWNSLMYRYWSDPRDFVGKDILAVATSEIRVEYPYYQNHMSSMNNIHPLDVEKNGQRVNRLYTRLLHGYRLINQ